MIVEVKDLVETEVTVEVMVLALTVLVFVTMFAVWPVVGEMVLVEVVT